MNRFFISLLLLFSFSFVSFSQKISPLEGPIVLSGNFGELRSFHFHSGMDMRTGGEIGKKVYAVADGTVVRILVSPTGYGNALYVEHKDGTMTLYAHLDRFNSRITEVVRKYQYAHKTFKADMYVHKMGLHVSAGEVIALSGNTGSSGGPHLHYEIRDVRTGTCLNAQKCYDVPDHKAPEIYRLYIYTIDRYGCVSPYSNCAVKKNERGEYVAGVRTVPEGLFGIAVHALDRMDGNSGKLGVYSGILKVDGHEVSRFDLDTIDFSEGRRIYWLEDFSQYRLGKTVYRMFGKDWNSLTGCRALDGGFLGVEKDSTVNVRLEMSDLAGNRSFLSFAVRGIEGICDRGGEKVWFADEENHVRSGICSLTLHRGTLFAPFRPDVKEIRDTLGKVMHRFVDDEQPLLKNAEIVYDGGGYTNKHVVCFVDGNKSVPLQTEFRDGKLMASSRILGTYTVEIDTLAPKITYLGVAGSKYRFRVKDDLSGLEKYSAYVGGKWVLMSYDAKSRTLECDVVDIKRMFNNNGERFAVKVSDAVGNSSEWSLPCAEMLYKGGVKQ